MTNHRPGPVKEAPQPARHIRPVDGCPACEAIMDWRRRMGHLFCHRWVPRPKLIVRGPQKAQTRHLPTH